MAQDKADEDCKVYKYGDHCFTNTTEHTLTIRITRVYDESPPGIAYIKNLKLPPGENQVCIYRAGEGAYNFVASIEPESPHPNPYEVYLEGEINVIACEEPVKNIK